MPVGAWNRRLPIAVSSLKAQASEVDLSIALLDASQDPRVMRDIDPIRPLIAYFRSHPDDGQAAAILEGWNAEKADIYGWLNTDDFLYPSSLARVEQAFKNHPDAGLVYGQSMMIDGFGRYVGPHPCFGPPGPSICRSNNISQPSAFVRSEALARVGGVDPGLEYTMDWDLWVRLFKADVTFTMIEDTLSGVVLEPGTKTMQMNPTRAREIARLVARSCGRGAAIKSLVAFWMQHQAEAGPLKTVFRPLRNALRHHSDRKLSEEGALAEWEIVNTSSSKTNGIKFIGKGPLRWRTSNCQDWRECEPGSVHELPLEPFHPARLYFDLEHGNPPQCVSLL